MKNIRPGHFGPFGGQFVPETIMPALIELEKAYAKLSKDKAFARELSGLLQDYAGRPTPLYHAARLSKKYGYRIYLKREDLNHTGSHKINNTLGQGLLAKRMGKKRIIAETGAGQHGVASATVAALLGLECVVYMGAEDVRRQALNVFKMHLLGAEVVPVSSGSRTLKDAINEAMRDWVTNIKSTYYVIGSAVGPHPYPLIVRNLQRIIGLEVQKQILKHEKRQPDAVIACVGGGSNSIGIFHPYLGSKTRLIGVEAAGHGLSSGEHGATLSKGSPGVLHGSLSYVLQNSYGQITETHSISAGLDYPGVGPEHSYLKDSKQATYVSVTDKEALAAFQELSELEGIIPALESSHAVAYLKKLKLKKGSIVVVNISGRGDKDVDQVADMLGAR